MEHRLTGLGVSHQFIQLVHTSSLSWVLWGPVALTGLAIHRALVVNSNDARPGRLLRCARAPKQKGIMLVVGPHPPHNVDLSSTCSSIVMLSSRNNCRRYSVKGYHHTLVNLGWVPGIPGTPPTLVSQDGRGPIGSIQHTRILVGWFCVSSALIHVCPKLGTRIFAPP